MPRRFTQAVRAAEALGAVVAVAVLAILFLPRLTGGGDAAPAVEQPDLNVAVVPAVDSAGFFVALHQGLFAAHGLQVTFVPAVSSETVINAQALDRPLDRVDISCGNYVSYIQAQENYDQGKRSSSAGDAMVAADLDIFAEGSVMETGAQGLYVLPGSHIRTLADLEGKTIGVNAPGNILYLLAASALADNGLSVSGVHFAYYPLPQMAAMLKAGQITAAVLPEPFARPNSRWASRCSPTWTRAPPPPSPFRAAPSPGSGRRGTRRPWPRSGPRSSRARRSRTPTGPRWNRPWRRCPRRSESPR
jgi:ABC-type nitrate/sulfonate/bicarbonate transport system substrate-binding protein